MKAFRILICVVLSLAMLLGMVAVAEPFVDAAWILRNLTLELGDESITLPQELRLKLMADETGAKLGFELGSGEKALLPLQGEIDASGLRFSLDDSGRVYSVDQAMILEMMDLDEADLAMLQMIADLTEQGAAAVAALVAEENLDKLTKLADDMWAAMTGAPAREAEIDIEGGSYPGVIYEGGVSLNSSLAVLDLCFNTGVEEWDSFWENILNIVSASTGTRITGFSDVKAMLMAEEGLTEEEAAREIGRVSMEIGGDETIMGERMTMTMTDEASGMDTEMTMEAIATASRVDMTMTQTMAGLDALATDMVTTFGMDVENGAVTGFDFVMGYDSGYEDVSGGIVDSMNTGITFALDGAAADGLWAVNMDVDFENEFCYGPEGEAEVYTEAVSLDGSYAEAPEADGSVTSAVALNAAYGDQAYGLSFDFNAAKGSGLEGLQAAGAYALTEDDESVAYTLLQADAMGLMGDLMELSADESVLKVVQAVTDLFTYQEYDYDEAYGYDEVYEDKEDYTEEVTVESESQTVFSMEEAAAIYTGAMPAFAVPEGYALSYVDVSSTDLFADYVNEAGDYISLYVMDFGTDMSDMVDGVEYYDDGEGAITAAEFVNGSNYVMLYFAGVTQQEAEAIVGGVSF